MSKTDSPIWVKTLEWYGEKAAAISGRINDKNAGEYLMAVMTELALDGGRRAGETIATESPKEDQQPSDDVEWINKIKSLVDELPVDWTGTGDSDQKSLEVCNFFVRCQIIWAKPSITFSRGDYHWQHEPCWYAVKKGNRGNWAGDRKQSTLWEIAGTNPAGRSTDQNNKATGHGTQKPVECMARPIRNHDGDVYDPFGGSGTTMIAGHQLGRKVYMIDIDPKYCQVVIDRMLKFDPQLVVKKNGVIWP